MIKYAFIFARGGSKGLKNKNLQFFKGETLVERTINQAIKSNLFRQIILSSDSEKILRVGKNKNILTIKRPKKLCSSKSPEMMSWLHAINYLKKKNLKMDLMVVLPCTSPLRSISDIRNSITKYNKNVHMVMTVTKSKYHPSFNIVKMLKKNVIKTHYGKKNKKFQRRQDVKNNYTIANSVYVFEPKKVVNKPILFYKRVIGVEVPKDRAIDIDDKIDLKISKALTQ